MSITEVRTYSKDVRFCFEVSKQVLEKAGCKIARIRDFAWLIQATKTVDGHDY